MAQLNIDIMWDQKQNLYYIRVNGEVLRNRPFDTEFEALALLHMMAARYGVTLEKRQ